MILIIIKNNGKYIINEISETAFIEQTKLKHYGYFHQLATKVTETDVQLCVEVYRHVPENCEVHAFKTPQIARAFFKNSETPIYSRLAEKLSIKYILPKIFSKIDAKVAYLHLREIDELERKAVIEKLAYKLLSRSKYNYQLDKTMFKSTVEYLHDIVVSGDKCRAFDIHSWESALRRISSLYIK